MRFFIYFLLQACLAVRPEDYTYALFLQAMEDEDDEDEDEDDEDEDDFEYSPLAPMMMGGRGGWGLSNAWSAVKRCASAVKNLANSGASAAYNYAKSPAGQAMAAKALNWAGQKALHAAVHRIGTNPRFLEDEDEDEDDFEQMAPMMMGGRGGWGLSNVWNGAKKAASWVGNKVVAAAKNPANQAMALNLAKTYGPKLAMMAGTALLR
jgi:hypothetical protein